METVLITGGAGFIGSHTADRLLEAGYHVRIFDNLDPQVHGGGQQIPGYLNNGVEFIRGDVRDREALAAALQGVDYLFHLAAAVGVGQSMYEIEHYTSVNTLGAATLLDLIANGQHHIKKLIVASSMSIYGEGQYECTEHGVVYPKLRSPEQLAARQWELRCPMVVERSTPNVQRSTCNAPLKPLPTDEDKPLHPTSIYAITKRDHEEMFLAVGRAYGIPTVALRYFNTYGPRQALSNPYTGVAAIFSARLLNGKPPLVFEDGRQRRDFIHVSDIAQANYLALRRPEADYEVLNIGTGVPHSVLDVADLLAAKMGLDLRPSIEGKYRAGDVRHCYADISKARQRLGFEPRVAFEDGIKDLIEWVRVQQAEDRVERAAEELVVQGLLK